MYTVLEEMIERKGLKKIWVAKEIGISTRQLQNWLNYENISQVITFIKLLEILEIPLIEVAEDMKDKGKI